MLQQFTISHLSLIFTDNLEQLTYPLRVGFRSSRFWWNSSDCSLLDGEGWCLCFEETCYLHLKGSDRFNLKLVGVSSLWAKNGKSLNWALYYQWLSMAVSWFTATHLALLPIRFLFHVWMNERMCKAKEGGWEVHCSSWIGETLFTTCIIR
jgi:hypothetical protein